MRRSTVFLGMAIALVTAGCAGHSQTAIDRGGDQASVAPLEPRMPALNHALFAESAGLPSTEQLFELAPEQAEAFLAFYHAESRNDVPEHHRLRDYLESRLWGFDYRDQTLLASDALTAGEGNCMSLAMLTFALAKLVGLEIEVQRVNSEPVYDRDAGVTLSSDHVRTEVFQPKQPVSADRIVFRPASVIIDYFPTQRGVAGEKLDETEFFAMFYRNLAVEALTAGEQQRAFGLTRLALDQWEDQPDALNLLAIMHRRAGDTVRADALYDYARAKHPQRVDLLNNHAMLLQSIGREDHASELKQRIEQLRDPNPYRWLDLGMAAWKRGDDREAMQLYQRASDIAPYLHEPYWYLAMLYFEQGRKDSARQALETAASLSHRGDDRRRYEAKRQALN
jgi:Flp pilus assembly protein TadD